MDKDIKELTAPLMRFTFAYAAVIYVFMISFIFWMVRKDIKPEK